MSSLYVVVTLLASWRLGRLLAVDEITRPLRHRVILRNPDGKLAYLVTCPWCVSIWTAPALVVGPVFWPDNRWLMFVNVCLAASLAAGIGQSIEDRLDR
jgi:hypothetical protein